MDHIPFLVAAAIVTVLVFDFANGFHDTANAMALHRQRRTAARSPAGYRQDCASPPARRWRRTEFD
ncbi:hypothetical protein [Streptomyces naphthomycinicus]|uniref:hypothetical protein n=1 Tax=Streptomyces naphthomycinicus TaxID=2872625 RepID=UPI001CEC3722|nr:hypothetical protein [Streptomyces sp. TML10]